MKNIYFVQANISCKSIRSYLPYAVGCLISYSWQFPEIANEYNVADIFFLREKPGEILKKLDNPYLIALSCSTWNIEYNKVLASLIKNEYPECSIVFGGHNITDETDLFNQCNYVDYFIYGEGEEPFYMLLKAKAEGTGIENVQNIMYRDGDKIKVNEGFADRNVENYPSPYLTGVFDRLIDKNPNIEFNITNETNRGCPYSCAFCDWSCSGKVRAFSMQRVKGEIDWMAEHKIPYCMPGDANFGILSRDVEIAEYLVSVREKTGYPEVFKPCYAKNSLENVFKAGRLLNSCGADKGVTISCQSMSDEVLKNINRINTSTKQYQDLVNRFSKAGIPTYTELIVGLPGETYESFCRGVCMTIEQGQHNSLSIYMCNVYPGSPLNKKEYRERFGIKTVHIPISTAHYSPDFNGVPEYYDIVVQTDAMPFTDWVKSNIFATAVQCFHHMGLLRCFSMYLRKTNGLSYIDFYSALVSYIFECKGTIAWKFFNMVYEKLSDTQVADWTYQDDRFSGIGWFFDEGAFLEFAYAGSQFWDEISEFLKTYFTEDPIFEALLNYQKQIIRLPGSDIVEIESDYDFYHYFSRSDIAYPEKKKTILKIQLEKSITDWIDYSREIIWFGKRRGATLVTNPREHVEVLTESRNE